MIANVHHQIVRVRNVPLTFTIFKLVIITMHRQEALSAADLESAQALKILPWPALKRFKKYR